MSIHCTYTGTVIRITTVKILEAHKLYMCNKCNQTFLVEADFEQYFKTPKPVR